MNLINKQKSLQSEYFFDNKPTLQQKLPSIKFEKVPGRKDAI